MNPLDTFLSDHAAPIAAALAHSNRTPLLLIDRARTVLDCNQRFLDLIGSTNKPTGALLDDLLSAGSRYALIEGDLAGRVKLNLKDGQGEVQTLECLVVDTGEATLLIGERTLLLQSTLVSAISALNDEMVNLTRDLQKKRAALEHALAHVKTLEAILPICSYCKKIRDEQEHWQPVEAYVRQHTDSEFSHSICPECTRMLFPEFFD